MDNNSLWPGWGKWILLGAMFVLLFVLLAIFTPESPSQILQSRQAAEQTQETLQPYTLARAKQIEGNPQPWMTSGPLQAPAVIVEYTDFTCPHCLASYPAVRLLRTNFADKVKLVLRSYAATDRAVALELAGHCAGEQGKYWEMSDKLFQNQNDTLGNDFNALVSLGAQTGLNANRFSLCLSGKKYLDAIKKDMQDSQALKIQGTPTWFFNGIQQQGELSIDGMTQIVNDLTK